MKINIYRMKQHLKQTDLTTLAVPVFVLLVCALPVAALCGVAGLMDAGQFLVTLLLVAFLLIVVLWLRSYLNWLAMQQGPLYVVPPRPEPISDTVNTVFDWRESLYPCPRLSRIAVSDDKLAREDYAQYLLDDILRSRGRNQWFCHQGP